MPDEMEPKLKRGRWLILVYAAYSLPDVRCIGQVVEAATTLKANVQIGIRGFFDEGENSTWCPACKATDSIGTPIWVLIEDGDIVDVRRGAMDAEEISHWCRQVAD